MNMINISAGPPTDYRLLTWNQLTPEQTCPACGLPVKGHTGKEQATCLPRIITRLTKKEAA